jgi:hypothetical protein
MGGQIFRAMDNRVLEIIYGHRRRRNKENYVKKTL